MPHRPHGPISREQQVDGLGLCEPQEGAELFPGPLLGGQRALARHPVVEELVNRGLFRLRSQVGWRSYSYIPEQALNEHIMFERVREKDGVVDQGVIEGLAVRLVLK